MVMDMHLLSDTDMGVSAAASEEESPYMTEISDLPHTVIHHIFGMLGPKELCIASAVCKDWRELNRDNTSNRVILLGPPVSLFPFSQVSLPIFMQSESLSG